MKAENNALGKLRIKRENKEAPGNPQMKKKLLCEKTGIKSLLRSLLADKRAEMTYIDSVVSMVVIMLLIVLMLNVFSFVTLKQDLSYISSELADAASSAGCVSSEVAARFSELCRETGLDAGSVTYSFSGTSYIGETDRVQYGELIRVRVSCSTKVMGSGIFTLPATVCAEKSCLCEKYWK